MEYDLIGGELDFPWSDSLIPTNQVKHQKCWPLKWMNYLTILLVSSQWVWSEKRVKAKAQEDYRLSRGRNPFDLCLEKTQTSRKAFLWESIKGLFQWASWLQVIKAGFNELGESTVQVPLQVQFSSQVLKGRTFIKGRFATRLKSSFCSRSLRKSQEEEGASLVRASLFPLRIKSFLDRTQTCFSACSPLL